MPVHAKPWARLAGLAAFVMAPIAACGGDGSDDSADTPPDSVATPMDLGSEVAEVYAPELGVDLAIMASLPSGLHMRDLEVGTGEMAGTGARVSVDYTGWLPNGVEFDASRGNPIAFTLGVGEVIEGWELGIPGMRAGGRRMLVIPPGLAYGERGRPGVIPPNATLVFDVRLVTVQWDSTAAPPDTSARNQ